MKHDGGKGLNSLLRTIRALKVKARALTKVEVGTKEFGLRFAKLEEATAALCERKVVVASRLFKKGISNTEYNALQLEYSAMMGGLKDISGIVHDILISEGEPK